MPTYFPAGQPGTAGDTILSFPILSYPINYKQTISPARAWGWVPAQFWGWVEAQALG